MAGLFDALTEEGGLPAGAASSTGVLESLSAILDGEADASDEDFDWFSLGTEHIVVGEQRPIAVYRNGDNGIVIRERGDDSRNDDMFIVLRDALATRALIAALAAEIGG